MSHVWLNQDDLIDTDIMSNTIGQRIGGATLMLESGLDIHHTDLRKIP